MQIGFMSLIHVSVSLL